MRIHTKPLTTSSDFAGLAGVTISTIGTLALVDAVGKTVRDFNRPPRRRASHKRR